MPPLLPEVPRSCFLKKKKKKRSGNLTKSVSYQDIFSKARAMRKTSVFLLKTDLPAELKQRGIHFSLTPSAPLG